jgi:hypothetical protein
MFDISYYSYVLNIIKNTLSPDIDNTLYNPHKMYVIQRQAIKDSLKINNDLQTLFFNSYEYLTKYINEYIKYFSLDISIYTRLYKYNQVIE